MLEHGAKKKSVAVHRKQQHVCGHQCAPGYVRQGASFPCWSCWAVRKSGRRRRRGRASSVPTLSRSPTGFSSGDDGCHQSTLHFYILRCTSWCMIRIWLLSNQWFHGYWLPCHLIFHLPETSSIGLYFLCLALRMEFWWLKVIVDIHILDRQTDEGHCTIQIRSSLPAAAPH